MWMDATYLCSQSQHTIAVTRDNICRSAVEHNGYTNLPNAITCNAGNCVITIVSHKKNKVSQLNISTKQLVIIL